MSAGEFFAQDRRIAALEGQLRDLQRLVDTLTAEMALLREQIGPPPAALRRGKSAA